MGLWMHTGRGESCSFGCIFLGSHAGANGIIYSLKSKIVSERPFRHS